MWEKRIRGMSILSGAVGLVLGGYVVGNESKKTIDELEEQSSKITGYYRILNRWLMLRQKGITFIDYFSRNGYYKIAIYGMKELGERLYDELKGTDIKVVCIIDKMAEDLCCEVPVITPEENIPACDAIIVTASYYYQSIELVLAQKVKCPIIPIDEVVYEA